MIKLYANNRKQPITLAEPYVGDRGPGYHGTVTDAETGEQFMVYGAECNLEGCYCAVTVKQIKGGPDASLSH